MALREGAGVALKLVIATVLVIACLLSAQVYAVSYQIPLRGPGYPSLDVSVEVPRGWAADSVREAMQIWNQAQIWFARTYFPNGRVYTFTEANAHYVHVRWAPYTPIYGGEALYNCVGDNGMNCTVMIVLTYNNGTNLSSATILHVALHEFGHVLGLRHANPNIIPEDLMNPGWPANPAMAPSTLDLYAVHLLASAIGTISRLGSGDIVTLPANIPYMTYESGGTTSYTTLSQVYSTSNAISITTQEDPISSTLQTSTTLFRPATIVGPTIYLTILVIIGVIAITGLYLRRRYGSATTSLRISHE